MTATKGLLFLAATAPAPEAPSPTLGRLQAAAIALADVEAEEAGGAPIEK